eukprot:8961072-Ditylum_brightwellii.AAC.1
MYTNIKTDVTMIKISTYLQRNKANIDCNIEALIAALDILMRWNIFIFGDIVWHQMTGAAMGTTSHQLGCALLCHHQRTDNLTPL